MKKLLVLLLTTLLAFSLTGCGGNGQEETGDKGFTVGVLQFAQHPALDAATQGFIDELNKEFDNITFISENANGEVSNCATMANGFVAENVDLIMANATPALQAVTTATATIPVLGTSVTEYGIALGIDGFTGVCGGNVSGTSDLANIEQQAQMILDLVANVKTVGILYCGAEDNSKYQFEVAKKYLEGKGIKVEEGKFSESNDMAAFTQDLCSKVDAIYIPTDNAAASAAETIDGVARAAGIPIVTGEENTCVVCGIATQSIDYYELGVITGQMAGRILRGEEDIANMKVEYYSDHFEEAKKFNPELCDLFGITVPEGFEAIK